MQGVHTCPAATVLSARRGLGAAPWICEWFACGGVIPACAGLPRGGSRMTPAACLQGQPVPVIRAVGQMDFRTVFGSL